MQIAPAYVLIGVREDRKSPLAKLEAAGRVQVLRVYLVDRVVAGLTEAARELLLDRVREELVERGPTCAMSVVVTRQPGVTDDAGRIAQMELARLLPELAHAEQRVFFGKVYLTERVVPLVELRSYAETHLANPIIDSVAICDGFPKGFALPKVMLAAHPEPPPVSLEQSDDALITLSKSRGLSLSLREMQAIRDHYRDTGKARKNRGMPAEPTHCELEIFAQTWSEHCKHKEFNARIMMDHAGRAYEVDSLFKTFIRKPTEAIRAKYGAEDWMRTVFSDNAGVVDIDEQRVFALKVETHNSPSAIDPVGGAMTGVLGTNRDAFGTGKGGAKLLFNTNVLCFGPKDYDKPLLPGQMHPARILEGVVTGIERAGNQCGVPTVSGAILFDDRFSGKPLVYCGTGAIMPKTLAGTPSWEKDIRPGDRILMAGGRVGQDGIHGATFSSGELAEGASRAVVQIGSPFTQKLLSDFMEAACLLGLVPGSTDNGAGGLSSSVGELAQSTGGAKVDLGKVPLKYAGLLPWEIFLSESQERMTLAVRGDQVAAVLALAAQYDVEVTDIGEFTASGSLDIVHGAAQIAAVDLHFLHEGVPRKEMNACWEPPTLRPAVLHDEHAELGKALHALLRSPNIASRERIIRTFDHEVKGKTIIKALMGEHGIAPQDAAVMRVSFDSHVGVAIASGICPKFGDLDPYEMSAGAFDEALRSLVSVGARLPSPGENPSWSACDNFCVPDSDFEPVSNPDGKEKLGKLVRMCEALRDMSLFFDVPMTSGKDSMKNDFRAGGVKISVPPTVLYTMVAKVPDVRAVTTSEFKAAGDVIYLMGETRDELGGSEYLKLSNQLGDKVPRVRMEAFKKVYHARARVQALVASSHDLSDGGLAVALAECCFGAELGCSIELPKNTLMADELTVHAHLFAESHGRLLVSVPALHVPAFERETTGLVHRLGVVNGSGVLRIVHRGATVVNESVDALRASFREGGV
jgi:phosphoribosylformylglycinamidine synthase subunit PurSL